MKPAHRTLDAFGPAWESFVMEEAGKLGCVLDPPRAGLLARHALLVLAKNREMNLTSITDPAEFAEKHVLDSLALCAALPSGTRTLWDLGSGAGFPGMVAAAVQPSLSVTLVESRSKKAAFLSFAASELMLSNVSVANARAEALLSEPGAPLPDVCAARAVASLAELFRLCKAYLAAGGLLIAMKGPDAEAEMVELAKKAGRKKALRPVTEMSAYGLPAAGRRALVFLRGEKPAG
ncbi:MAG: 16S rRNA (guanine(527)-N(7))-methyltransferase RsmG [Thermodesulfobacteriota bacterium]